MRFFRHMVPFALICVIGWAAATAHAGRFLPHKHGLTVQQKVAYFKKNIAQERMAIRWLESRFAPRTLQRVTEIRWNRHALRWSTSLLAQYTAKLPPLWPPHHQMWLCFHSIEAPGAGWQANTGNGYYGGLQMHAGWGYGTSYHASDDSQMTQEWAAEHGYKASGYSQAFLWQQWAADARCFA